MCQTLHLSLAILLRHSPLLTSKLRSTSRSSNLLMWSMRKLICLVRVPWTREKAETTKNGMLSRGKRNRGERIQLSLLQEHQKLVSAFSLYLRMSTLLILPYFSQIFELSEHSIPSSSDFLSPISLHLLRYVYHSLLQMFDRNLTPYSRLPTFDSLLSFAPWIG